MRKSRAIFLLITTLVVIIGYVAWAVWEPAPTLQSMVFNGNVDAAARSAAEADFRANPPKARKLTWRNLLQRLANPYRPREEPSIRVGISPHTDGGKLLYIGYPQEDIFLGYSHKSGKWSSRQFVVPKN
ncbi:MAG: hypothetical protein V4819_25025 [Verrucomicrobiota bacterium]